MFYLFIYLIYFVLFYLVVVVVVVVVVGVVVVVVVVARLKYSRKVHFPLMSRLILKSHLSQVCVIHCLYSDKCLAVEQGLKL